MMLLLGSQGPARVWGFHNSPTLGRRQLSVCQGRHSSAACDSSARPRAMPRSLWQYTNLLGRRRPAVLARNLPLPPWTTEALASCRQAHCWMQTECGIDAPTVCARRQQWRQWGLHSWPSSSTS